MPSLLSIIESPMHPDLSGLYGRLSIDVTDVNSMRKAIASLKAQAPDFVVADFVYGYGNNYAGANISNLDVFLRSLPKYAPEAAVIVLVERRELKYAHQLGEMFALHAILPYPVREPQMAAVL